MTTPTKERLAYLRSFLKERVKDLKSIEKAAKKSEGKLVTPIRMDLYLGPIYADLLGVLEDYERAREAEPPAPTDHEREVMASYVPEGWDELSTKIYADIKALILAAPKKVSRERVKYWIPCTCDVAYTGRGLSAPDCPFHAFTGWEDLLNELGIEVEP